MGHKRMLYTVRLGMSRSLFLFCFCIRTIGSLSFPAVTRSPGPALASPKRRLYDDPLTINDQSVTLQASPLVST